MKKCVKTMAFDIFWVCNPCQLKKSKVKKSIVVKPIISDDFNRRCQVDLIDLQSQPDGEFRFVMVYQDHLRHVHVPLSKN